MEEKLEPKFYVRFFDKERDYEAVCDWWQSRGLMTIPANALPKTGIVACEEPDGEAIAVAWLIMDNSVGVSFVEWTTTKPGLSFSQSRRAIMAVYEMLERCAKELGYVIFYAVTSKVLGRASKSLGWEVLHTDMVVIGKVVA